MGARNSLPAALGPTFAVRDALAAGVSAGRLRGADLERPFHGIRARDRAAASEDPWGTRRAEIRWLATALAPRLRRDQFFSHETAAAIWGAPLYGDGPIELHVSVMGRGAVARRRGVRGHRAHPDSARIRAVRGLPVASFATMWAMLGADLTRDQLVAVGDFGCRLWRDGVNRPDPGREPLTTREQLAAAMNASRRHGGARLREAHPLIRTDAWSPRETTTRLILLAGGLPEPELNRDLFDAFGGFLACVDMSYPEFKVAVEYQGQLHGQQYARDIERIERLRAAGWIVIQVTADTIRYPNVVVRRVREALLTRGWRPTS